VETEYSAAHPKQADKTMLSENDGEMCEDVSGVASGCRESSPLSVEHTQCDNVNGRKLERKQGNNKRNRRSTGLDKEGLKTEYVIDTS
jgi:hypothetical protein